MLKTLSVLLLAFTATAATAATDQDQSTAYKSAVQAYNAGQYSQSCSAFHQLYSSTSNFKDVSPAILATEKSSGIRGFDWQQKAWPSDNAHQWAKECAEWYHSALRNRADEDSMLVGDAVEYAQRAEKHIADEQHVTAPSAPASPVITPQPPRSVQPTGCATDDAMQKSVKLVFPCVDLLLQQARTAKQSGNKAQARAAYQRLLQVNSYAGFQRSDDVDKEARDYLNQTNASNSAPPPQAGTGAIPNGTYKCYTANTATILAGGSAVLNPGSWGGDLQIKGDTYLMGTNPWGHYKVGAHGKITWNGGAYSASTLGRYILDKGTPAIVIGWQGVDGGYLCKQ